jgi:hypothetical protein
VGKRISLRNEWSEGPGIIRDRLGHIRPVANGRVTFEVVRPVGDRKKPGTWDLYSETVQLQRLNGEILIINPSTPQKLK